MVRVIDVINCRGWIKRVPTRLERAEGILVILDHAQISSRPNIPNNRVTIHRLDDTTIELIVTDVEVNPGNVVALFFKDVFPEEIPRLSMISWLE